MDSGDVKKIAEEDVKDVYKRQVKEVFESKEFERIFYTGEESWVREEEHK